MLTLSVHWVTHYSPMGTPTESVHSGRWWERKKTIDFEYPDFLNKSLHTNNSTPSWLLFWNFHFYVSKHNKCSLASCRGIKMFCHLELAWSLRVRFCHWKRNRWPTVSPHTFICQISLSIKGIWPESSHISKLSSHLCTVSLTETRKVGETRSRPLRVDSYKYICFLKSNIDINFPVLCKRETAW